ncbi:unnamed protein product, partial [marine sediment metagenome]
ASLKAQIPAIQATQKAEARRNKEWRGSTRERQAEFHQTLETIQQNQIEILRQLRRP